MTISTKREVRSSSSFFLVQRDFWNFFYNADCNHEPQSKNPKNDISKQTTEDQVTKLFVSGIIILLQTNTVLNDTKITFPYIRSFRLIAFGLNYLMTTLTGKDVPEHWISALSSSSAEAICRYIFCHHISRPTIAGGVTGYFMDI